MWLAYVDESGNTGTNLNDPDQPIHWMAAVLVPEDQILTIRQALDGIVASVSGVDDSAELHGSELFGGEGPWRGITPSERIRVYEEALMLLGDNGCEIAHASVDKRKMYSSNRRDLHPHILAFQFLAEKLQRHVRSQNDPMKQRALIVADESDENNHYQLQLLRSMQDGSGGIGKSIALTNIVDTVHFVESRVNRGVQLVDLVAYALNRCCRIWEKREAGDSVSAGDVTLEEMVEDLITPYIRTWRVTWP
ncbi:DUF3800 domain-containing protein [Nesterenkonia alkaliphila]|uniref:DUF3800 domain-containing protein n=1 Tax=Nesterenkonia alkaliphila TaxID=1463631 RepID=A0A7K1UGV4_9MICC|nr:DUF3800 domain-containing protein [Nesterenkonia alkaliphila]MVT25700.1 DUF3800 domain-containing protein [Nesterenkonia alkaliphila]GFZ85191.1 hypothetical protein GCM10011359_12880 [Nesterenkonia alkaliphila]